jgi:hypothetical protein
MALSGTNSQAVAQPLPLFRPEALAAQERMHGDVLRIRPLSLAFFPCLGAALLAVALAYLFAGHYTETGRVTGFLLAQPQATTAPASATRPSTELPSQALFVVPGRWIGAVQRGATVEVRCPGCADPGRKLVAEVVDVSQSSDQNAATYKIILALPSDSSVFLPRTSSPQSSTRLEAEIPLGRRPLIHWLMQQSEP